ncbi:UPF0606 protein KIAA1549-like [Sinocyclocheilus anshuiensis]|uniref:UPF0606 protein KIAA1549-like n=1 Tax=Sinocyclocheilus anshuiensis TaxID=1608454 RepID=UPI0007B913E1|nr:PREDICTED: UPF0606 protein KIAA1549-like [Sinocyclocheilus anshuiensis]
MESSGSRMVLRSSRRLLGCCTLLLAAAMLVGFMATSGTPVAVKLPSNMSRRSLNQLPTRTRSPPALSSSSSSSSPHRSERTRRPAHTPPGAKHPSSPGRHDSASRIDPTPSLGSEGSGNLGDGAQGIHLLLRPPDLLTPSQMPPLHDDIPPTPAPPTLVPPEDQYPVHSAEVDWGSGDYLETLTFMGSEGEEFSLVTTLPTHGYDPYDTDNDATVSYNTAFPSRPVLPLSSRDLQPSVTVKYGTNLRTAHPTDPRLPLAPDSAHASDMDDDLDFDWAELFPIEPTEMLLPDMNSLEYYNTLQAKENASIVRNRTHLHINPTHTVGPTHTPTATLGKIPDEIDRTTPRPIPSVTPTPPQKPTKPPIASTTETQRPPEGPDKGVPSIPTSHVGKTRPPVPTALPPPGTSEGPVIQAVTLKPPATKPRMTTIKTTTRTTTTTTTTMSTTSLSTKSPPPTTPRIPLSIAPRQYVCNITKPDMYLVRVGMPSGSSVAFAKAHVREILRREFNRSVELQVLKAPPNFIFRAVSGPLVYTAISVINAVRQSVHSTSSSSILSVTTIYAVPDYKHQVHTVLQFVPSHVDVRLCSFSERVEKGLLMAYAEVRKRSQEKGNFTVHIVNITSSLPKGQRLQKAPVDITFAVRDSQGFLTGSDVSGHMRQLSTVEFSFYLGFPTLQIAEPFHYPELNVSHLLRTSWVKTVLLGVLDQRVNERTFQAKMERRLALLVGEGLRIGVSSRRWRRATSIGNNSVQLQPPIVKGFDFAKLHLGQHSNDDIMIIQEPAPLPAPVKEATPSEGGELNTPKSKSSSTKASRAARRRGRLSPSDGDSLGSEASSCRESAEESTRPAVTPSDSKPQHRKSKHSKNKLGAQPGSGVDEQLSSSSIFEHVDRLSRGSSDGTRRVSNKIQLIAMQPMPSSPSHPHNQALSPNLTDKMPDGAKVNSEIQVALRHKSEIEHHRNKIRLRAKRKGHYEFPSMEDIMAVFGDSSEQQRVYQQAQEQIHKILHLEEHTPSSCGEPRKSSKGRRSPRHRQRQNLSGSGSLRDKDRLISDGDAMYRKYPGVNNVAYVSDADQLPDAGSPSPTDEVFLDTGSPPSGPAPAPPSYVPPQPTIEEARQRMHSLLDDAFALVSPSSQGSPAPLTFTGITAVTGVGEISPGQPSSTSSRPSHQWASSSYPAAPVHSPFSARYAELGMSPTSVQGLLQRQTQGSGYVVSAEMQSDPGYSSRGQYGEEMPASSRPRPVGGSTGAQLHQLTQVGLSSRIGLYPGVGRSVSGPSGSSWAHYRSDEEISRPGSNREAILTFPEYSSSPVFQMPRTSLQDPTTPQGHLEASSAGYIAPEERSPPPQSSAFLIKAIREELQRLSQKQVAVVSYQS